MILIAESGSTKCDWVLIDDKGQETGRWKTIGFNPYFHTPDFIEKTLNSTTELKTWAPQVSELWFYGAGCNTNSLKQTVKAGLDRVFSNASVHVHHDLDAAGFSLYEGEPIIACILGTGSNCCYFDGENVIEETPALAYILGDEGSASRIGRNIITDYFYGKLPEELSADFEKEYQLTVDQTIEAVYHSPHPNVFLANFGLFAGKWAHHAYIQKMVKDGFDLFIENHVSKLRIYNTNVVSFVGTVAKAYQDILEESLREQGFVLGKIVDKPIDALVQYHLSHAKI